MSTGLDHEHRIVSELDVLLGRKDSKGEDTSPKRRGHSFSQESKESKDKLTIVRRFKEQKVSPS